MKNRKIHWINGTNSGGCEIQLFDRKYTLHFVARDGNWKEAEKDAQKVIDALETYEDQQKLASHQRTNK